MAERPLSTEEAALWARVLTSVRPLKAIPAAARSDRPAVPRKDILRPAAAKAPVIDAPQPGLFEKLLAAGIGRGKGGKSLLGAAPARGTVAPAVTPAFVAANTLDGNWDRKLARGLISPDRAIDLHGHNLSAAYATLDGALEQAIRAGDRVVLLVTGKPPRPASERPHAPHAYRGAIRAAVGDWLAGSRHAGAIAAVRVAHPRHGGAGALYIILRKSAAGRIY